MRSRLCLHPNPAVRAAADARDSALPFPQADAYARALEFLTGVTMPRGTVDWPGHPPTDIRGIAATASMVTNERLHPALVQLVRAGSAAHPRREHMVLALRETS